MRFPTSDVKNLKSSGSESDRATLVPTEPTSLSRRPAVAGFVVRIQLLEILNEEVFMDSHASSECGNGRQARHLDVKVADLIEHESRLVRHPAAALLAYLLRHLPPLVEETGIDDAVRVPLIEHLDVRGRLPLDEVADRHAALGRHGAERPVREDAQGLLEGGHDVLARRRRPAVPEEVGRGENAGCVGPSPRM